MDLSRRRDFLIVAIAFEGGLAFVALLAGWLVGIDPLKTWSWSARDAGWGVLATVPMLLFFFTSMRYPVGPLRSIRGFLIEHLGPILSRCAWYDLILLALLAGVGEEILFRGLLQPLLGLVGSNVVFGLVHSITAMYALIAGLIGLYLGGLQLATGNLLSPVVAHALYDYVAFLAVVREYRKTSVSLPRQAL